MKRWAKEYWEEERERYHAVVEPWVLRRRYRRSRREKHPVENIL